MTVQEAIQTLQNTPLTDRIQIIELKSKIRSK